MKIRGERIALEMQKEISDIIHLGVKDPRVGFLTVTAVEVSTDYTHAKVFISVLGDQEERERTMQALQSAKGYIRSEVARRIRLRVTPELHFKLDASIDYSSRIGQVLHEIAAREGTSTAESVGGTDEDG